MVDRDRSRKSVGAAVLVFAAVAVGGAAILAFAMSRVEGGRFAFILAGMWVPALARAITTRTVDRGFVAPLPVRRWGRPRAAIVLAPLAVCLAVYGAAAAVGIALGGVEWAPKGGPLNAPFNLIAAAVIGLPGAFGEEIGWRGYLQPRLDQAGVRGSLLIAALLEVAYHVPIVAAGAYLGGVDAGTLLALSVAGKIGASGTWTWWTYRLRSVWVAVWFHAIHNAVSQAVVPRLAIGPETLIGETGVLPVAAYLVAAGALCLVVPPRAIARLGVAGRDGGGRSTP